MTAMPADSPFMLSSRFIALVMPTTQTTTIARSSSQGSESLK